MLAERSAPHLHQAERADQNERQVGHHVPEVRDAAAASAGSAKAW